MFENIVSGIIGGVIVIIIERLINWYYKVKELKNGNSPRNLNSNIILTNELIETFHPERNYLKVKEILGSPDKSYEDFSIFEDELGESEKFMSDLYFLKNANLKITTVDNKSIHSITVFSYTKKLEIPGMYYPCENTSLTLGEAKICNEIIKYINKYTPVHTIRDLGFAIQNYSGAPFYKYITFFCFDDVTKVKENFLIDEFIGKPIEGFCLSNSVSTFYIHDYELR
ncbi:hypothetical protein JI747_016220 [Chryseobacterium sp. RG1]|uniref:Uncharacterized protein n=1 Tax=Chryseobacterium tagetis TaxID=2801334 RepID=A0ABS8A6Z7_9FLAO|nr:hypothetical protein [Chryseobacterium tagetis]MCA6068715.1 hypothetical protein [Chryseobacterium tagetis]